ncbi:MAG: hypothetical protein ACYCOU_08170 [Sulfobacillus sp.]
MRQIVREEIASEHSRTQLWQLLLGNHELESAVRRECERILPRIVRSEVSDQVNRAVSAQQLQAHREIRAALIDSQEFQRLRRQAAEEAAEVVVRHLREGKETLSAHLQSAIDSLVRDDRYNCVNAGFIQDLKSRADSMLQEVRDSSGQRLVALEKKTVEIQERLDCHRRVLQIAGGLTAAVGIAAAVIAKMYL